MDFIKKTACVFKKLVVDDLSKKYNLTVLNNIRNLKRCDEIYQGYNYIVIHNSVLQELQYKSELKKLQTGHHLYNKWSVVFILYKNIGYNIRGDKKIANIDLLCKNNIRETLKNLSSFDVNVNIDFDEVFLIGRKYFNIKDKLDKNDNCFSIICTIDLNTRESSNKRHNEKPLKNVENDFDVSNKSLNLRRKFLYKLKESVRCKTRIDYYNCINNCMYLDLEYTNDIYDDFSGFPVSKDTSCLFMIGVVYKNYFNFTTNDLSRDEELRNLKIFLEFLRDNITKNRRVIYIFHWSNADKYILYKTIDRYPILRIDYKDVLDNICLVDLLPIVKETIPDMQSYSLKKVSKKLLDIVYDTECQNGLQAMCTIIENNNILKLNSIYKSLLCFKNTKDIIDYNRLDTILLKNITRYFTGR